MPRQPRPSTGPRRTKARLLIRMLPGHESKGEGIRARAVGKTFTRRDSKGQKVAEHKLSERKPDRKPKP